MSLIVDEVKDYIEKYVNTYRIATYLHFRVRNSVADLYDDKNTQQYEDARAGYQS